MHADTNSRYHRLLSAFHERTGCPVLVNTSFNVRGEPIVCTPEHACRCLMGTETEVLVAGNRVLHKHRQDPAKNSTTPAPDRPNRPDRSIDEARLDGHS